MTTTSAYGTIGNKGYTIHKKKTVIESIYTGPKMILSTFTNMGPNTISSTVDVVLNESNWRFFIPWRQTKDQQDFESYSTKAFWYVTSSHSLQNKSKP